MADTFQQFLQEARDLKRRMDEIKEMIKGGTPAAHDEPDTDHATKKKPKTNEEGGGGPEKADETLAGAMVEPVSPASPAMSTDERGSESRWSLRNEFHSDEDPSTPQTPKTP
jgi:cell division septum initiation protein DivIVA